MDTKYRIESLEKSELDGKRWDDFVERSPQGSVFLDTDFLDAHRRSYRRFFILKGDTTKAGLVLFFSEDGSRVELADYVPYNGLLFQPQAPEQRAVKYLSEQFQLTEFVVEELLSKFESVTLSLPPEFNDLRPFQWHNYHSSNVSRKYEIRCRYTSYLNIAELSAAPAELETRLFKGLAESRQGEIKKARKAAAVAKPSRDVQAFMRFYLKLMEEQGVALPSEMPAVIGSICEKMLATGKAQLFAVDGPGGQPSYFTFFMVDKKRAYYLFGAGDSSQRESYAGTVALWDAFKILASNGVAEVDFVGVNSPRRGGFKLSFGGSLLSYFEVVRSAKTVTASV